jgi:hypothetical protein
MATTIKYGGPHARYSVGKQNEMIRVTAKPGIVEHCARLFTEEGALRWLCDRGLRKSKARQLLAAELRNEGPFADPKHPRRLDPAGK